MAPGDDVFRIRVANFAVWRVGKGSDDSKQSLAGFSAVHGKRESGGDLGLVR